MNKEFDRQALIIRQADNSDVQIMFELITHYLQFYKVIVPPIDKLTSLIEIVCKNNEIGCFLLAEFNKRVVGFATLYKLFSTFQAQQALILNDFYILPDYRKLGIGTCLFNACKDFCTNGNYAYIEWMTAPDNNNAINFYLKNNAKKTNWIVFTQ